MSVLDLIVEKISNLKGYHGDHLDFDKEGHKLALLLPELKKYNIHAEDGSKYNLYLITETSESDLNDLKLVASLAGFYNSRYVFEYFKHDRVKVPIGGYRFFIRKRCLDNPDNIFIALVIKWTASSDHRLIKSTLSVEEASRVAETLSIFHARGFQRPVESSREIVNENHDYIKDLMTKQLKTNFDHYLHVLFSHGHAYFSHPDRAYKLIRELYNSFTSFKDCADCDDGIPKVLCHGNLCGENLRFNNQDELTGILNWEHSNFGHVGLDLTYLMTTALTASDRRKNYLRILRSYYYSLVDKQSVPFQLHHLKKFYHYFLKYSVFFSLFGLVFTLESKEAHEHVKKSAVNKWEQTLYDAYEVESGKYMSSNEDLRII